MSEPQLTRYPYINGKPVPANGLSVLDRGLAYGDGVFETIRVNQNGPVLMSGHVERLQKGLQRLSITLELAVLEAELAGYPGFTESGIVKLIVTRGEGGRGYGSEECTIPTRIMTTHPEPAYPPSFYDAGISVYPCKSRLAHNPQLAGVKHLNRLEQVLARREWQGQDFQEGLMLDQQGRIVEGVFSNVFIVQGRNLLTPRLENCGVTGVMRNWLLAQFSKTDYNVLESELSLEDFVKADERFFCNSVYGVWPVCRFQQHAWTIGPITRLAQKMVSEHWCL